MGPDLHTSVVPGTPGQPSGSAPVAARGLGKSYDERDVLVDLDFTVSVGERVALLGANGAGKSTLLTILATLIAPSSGTLSLFGRPAGQDTVGVRRRLGMISHQPMLYRGLSARENLEFFGKLYGLADPGQRADELLDLVDLRARADDQIKTFSRGMTQRVAIARALMHDPELLLADEPFDGLDAPSVAALQEILTGLRERGKTLIVSNHDVAQSLAHADRVLVLRDRHIHLDCPAADVQTGDVIEMLTRK